MTRRFAPLAVMAVCFPFVLSGCMDNSGLVRNLGDLKFTNAWAHVEVLSLGMTKKTVFDHVATWVTGQDCSSPRAERSLPYCVNWPQTPLPPPEVYCYSSLARATCYAQPYVQANDHLIAFVPASIAAR